MTHIVARVAVTILGWVLVAINLRSNYYKDDPIAQVIMGLCLSILALLLTYGVWCAH